MVKNSDDKLLNEEDIRDLVIDSLLENDLIGQELYVKCGKPKHIQSLPGDLRTTDLNKLNRRKEAIKLRIDELNLQIAQKTLDRKINTNEIKKSRLSIKENKAKQKEEYEYYKHVSKQLKDSSKNIKSLFKQLSKELSKKDVTISLGADYWNKLMDKFIKYSDAFKINPNKGSFQNEKRKFWEDAGMYDPGYGLTSSLPEENIREIFGKFFNQSSERQYIKSNSDKVLRLVDEIYNAGNGMRAEVASWGDTGFKVEVAKETVSENQDKIKRLQSANEDIKKEIDNLKVQRKQLKDEGKLTDNRISATHDLAVPGDSYWDRENRTLYTVHEDGSIGSSPYYGPGASDHLYD